ncbi:MAG: penicillin-binding protein 1C [Hyphomicrobiaceae bacterium]|nr:penicillin-binding protein 1C [Hyphomicrobiaceae bacterium]
MSRRGTIFVVLALLLAGPIIIVEAAARWLPPPSMTRLSTVSATVLDSRGGLLRAFLTADGRWRLPMRAADLPPHYLQMMISYEDQRFFSHPGVDPIALVRAFLQLVRYGRVVSGASTITMQVARLLDPRGWSIERKLRQIVAARQLELRYTKDQILDMYLTLAPFGGNIEGVRAASLAYFRKEPRALDDRQSAMLIALPPSPERRRPDRGIWTADESAHSVLSILRQRGATTPETWERARRQPLGSVQRATLSFAAPHLAEGLRRRYPLAAILETTIEPSVQLSAERIAREAVAQVPPAVNVAIVVVRNRDGAVVGYVGGADYGSVDRAGQVDLAQAVRSPGSALKPFVYGIGFEQRIVHPSTIITDAPTAFGTYEPQNFAGDYAGDMTVRDALIRSINTGPVAILHRIGPQRFMSRLRTAGLPLTIEQSDAEAGLALALGGAGVRLLDLVRAYSALASRGLSRPLRILSTDPVEPGTMMMEPDAAWAVSTILADMPPPSGFLRLASRDGGRRVAYKTGTSYGFRDALAVGYDQLHTVGVWVGRPDGAPHLGAYGISVAAPILFRQFEALPSPTGDVAGEPPASSLARVELPERLVRFDAKPLDGGRQSLRIAFPQHDSTVIARRDANGRLTLPISVQGGMPPYRIYVDERILAGPRLSSRAVWTPPGRGAAKLVATDALGGRAEAEVWVEVPAGDAAAASGGASTEERRREQP